MGFQQLRTGLGPGRRRLSDRAASCCAVARSGAGYRRRPATRVHGPNGPVGPSAFGWPPQSPGPLRRLVDAREPPGDTQQTLGRQVPAVYPPAQPLPGLCSPTLAGADGHCRPRSDSPFAADCQTLWQYRLCRVGGHGRIAMRICSFAVERECLAFDQVENLREDVAAGVHGRRSCKQARPISNA